MGGALTDEDEPGRSGDGLGEKIIELREWAQRRGINALKTG